MVSPSYVWLPNGMYNTYLTVSRFPEIICMASAKWLSTLRVCGKHTNQVAMGQVGILVAHVSMCKVSGFEIRPPSQITND